MFKESVYYLFLGFVFFGLLAAAAVRTLVPEFLLIAFGKLVYKIFEPFTNFSKHIYIISPSRIEIIR